MPDVSGGGDGASRAWLRSPRAGPPGHLHRDDGCAARAGIRREQVSTTGRPGPGKDTR